jgi:tetratricopeptide (TPR) repeat protein
METYRPIRRSAAVTTLASLWGIAAAAGLLMTAGVLFQARGAVTPPQPAQGGQIWASLARVVGVAALDAPVAAPPPPAWLAPALVALALGAIAQACLCWARRPAALYAGVGAVALLATGGAVAGVASARAAATIGAAGERAAPLLAVGVTLAAVVAGAALALAYLGAARELMGKRRRVRPEAEGTSAPSLFRAGRALYEDGLTFAAARAWARALGRDPSNPDYLHALGLALTRMGERERAAAVLARALEADPSDARIRAAYERVTR